MRTAAIGGAGRPFGRPVLVSNARRTGAPWQALAPRLAGLRGRFEHCL